MKRKIFTLLTLLLTSVVGVNATESGSVTITWLPSTMTSITAVGTASVADLMTVNDLTYSSDVSAFALRSNQDSKNWGEFKFTTASNKQWNKDDYATFSVTIADGVTFTPTSAAVHAGGSGSGNSSAAIFATIQTSNGGSAIKKDGEGGVDLSLTTFSKTKYTGGETLNFYVHMGANSGKGVSLCNVVLSGTYEKEEVTTYDLTTTASPAEGGTISRSPNQASYIEGKSVTLTATPNYGYEFVNWTKGGVEQGTSTTLNITTAAAEEEYVANFNKLTTYALTTTANPVAGGTINRTPNQDEYLASENITLTAVPAEGYYFINWTKGGVEQGTDVDLDITTAAAAEEYVANFGKSFLVTYDIDDYNNTTTKALTNYSAANNINEKYADKDGNYTIPTYSHYYMYREGYMFSKWEDQDGNQYEKGNTITGITKDITLTPVWVATTQTLANSAAEATVTWNFGKSTILFNGWQNAPQVGYYTKPCTINGELIAVPMIVDATSGKVDNSTRTDALAQVNGGTKFTIPAIKGMTVVLTASNSITNTTVAGNKPSSGSGTKTATYNYTGENGTADIVIADGSYYQKIVVTYPKMTEKVTIGATGWSTFSSASALDFSTATPAGLSAYAVTGFSGSALTKSAALAEAPAETGLLLNGTAGETYTIPVKADAASVGTNCMVASVAGGTVNAGEDPMVNYVLMNVGGNPVFQWIGSTPATLGANKAYLALNDGPKNAGARGLWFDDDMTTGINAVNGEGLKVQGAEVYNLAGQRVLNPTKGLYIVNGKKVVVK